MSGLIMQIKKIKKTGQHFIAARANLGLLTDCFRKFFLLISAHQSLISPSKHLIKLVYSIFAFQYGVSH